MCTFNKGYFLLALILFFAEVIIALFVRDRIIRPYGGDFLVVILLYSMIKTVLNSPVFATAITVLLFSFLIETLQYFNLIQHLGLEQSKIARTIIGSSFAWIDMIAYTLGILTVLIVEKALSINEGPQWTKS